MFLLLFQLCLQTSPLVHQFSYFVLDAGYDSVEIGHGLNANLVYYKKQIAKLRKNYDICKWAMGRS
ncbi:MAG: hypothetical protein AUK63_1502 [bacterium P3]|nr:MAG: hypothetical protein AUK63_1502 [bacterium P3]KWW41102.1 MAG: hypothetical protein F083_1269 [bacterium F083]